MHISAIVAFGVVSTAGFSSAALADTCSYSNFYTASPCPSLDPDYNNNTLPGLGWYCCWEDGPYEAPSALPVSAWVFFDKDGYVEKKCTTSGSCKCATDLPGGISASRCYASTGS
ncbi:hypothetical protein GGR52DRAFT_534529 [Hypoxylon sp. FL1284]|nr:hypothetical protein GGR52DRAFT_534529 [Hypoxylon sp. FL1284]